MLSSSLKISISKDTSVSVRDQLIEQIGLQIASGVLKTKDKLPSIRALAQKLGIHHSTVTAVYNHLAEAGLLEIRQGSGVRVTGESPLAETKDNSLKTMFRQFLAQAADKGHSRTELRDFILEQLDSDPVTRILVIDRNPDFHAILSSELQPYFKIPIQPITFEQLNKQQQLLSDALVVTSFYHLLPLQNLPLDPTRFVLSTIEPGHEELETVKALRPGSIVAIVSVSPTLMKMATNMAASIRGEEIAIRCLGLNETKEITYLMKHTDAVICDRPSETTVRELAGKVPVKVFNLYPQSTIELIKTRLKKWG